MQCGGEIRGQRDRCRRGISRQRDIDAERGIRG